MSRPHAVREPRAGKVPVGSRMSRYIRSTPFGHFCAKQVLLRKAIGGVMKSKNDRNLRFIVKERSGVPVHTVFDRCGQPLQ